MPLSAADVVEIASGSEWAKKLLGGEPSSWGVTDTSIPSTACFHVIGRVGELMATQPTSGGEDAAAGEAIALDALKAGSSPCAGTMAFEFRGVSLEEDEPALAGGWRTRRSPSNPRHR